MATFKNRLFSKSKVGDVVGRFNVTTGKTVGEMPIEDYIGAFSVGNFFSGRYIGDNGKVFDEKSMAVEVNGISSEGLIYLGEQIATEFGQETVLVKDLNKNKIYQNDEKNAPPIFSGSVVHLANSNPIGNYDFSSVNKKSS